MSDEMEEHPSPIKIVRRPGLTRQPNWHKDQRVKLLEHILMYMENPALGYNKYGKKDLEDNVLPKVSPDIEEKPDESRKLEEIIYQYYRYANQIQIFLAKMYMFIGRGTPKTTRRESMTG